MHAGVHTLHTTETHLALLVGLDVSLRVCGSDSGWRRSIRRGLHGQAQPTDVDKRRRRVRTGAKREGPGRRRSAMHHRDGKETADETGGPGLTMTAR
jgi:hypothetical protein